MNNRDTKVYHLKKYLYGEWLLNVYLIRANKSEKVELDTIDGILEKYIKELNLFHLSDEFYYTKTGFALLHFGNRGVNLSIWHTGDWGGTNEVYCCSWYTYGRNIDNMSPLNDAEPLACYYELDIAVGELKVIEEVFDKTKSIKQFRENFIEAYMNYSDQGSTFRQGFGA